MQRKLETAIRHAKDRQKIAKSAGDDTLRRQEQKRLNDLTRKYKDFSEKSGLSVKKERMSVSGYYKVKSTDELTNIQNQRILKEKISNGDISLVLNPSMQEPHIIGSARYDSQNNKSYFNLSLNELQKILDTYHATGIVKITNSGQIKEILTLSDEIGVCLEKDGTIIGPTNRFTVHYSKKRTHIVPTRREIE